MPNDRKAAGEPFHDVQPGTTALSGGTPITRRTVLTGSALAAAAAMFGPSVLQMQRAQAASAASLNQVLAAAAAEEYKTLAQVKADWNPPEPWVSYDYEWCAWFVTYLLRNNGVPALFGVKQLRDHFQSVGKLGHVSVPGALIFYGTAHVGIVGPNGTATIEGNSGYSELGIDESAAGHWRRSVVWPHQQPWSSDVTYGYPDYAGADSTPVVTTPTTQEDDMQLIVVIADQGANDGTIYGSTAVVTAHRGFVQTSSGLGPRDELNAWTAIANALGFQVVEKHVDTNGFQLAARL
jgi:hypothetical protein